MDRSVFSSPSSLCPLHRDLRLYGYQHEVLESIRNPLSTDYFKGMTPWHTSFFGTPTPNPEERFFPGPGFHSVGSNDVPPQSTSGSPTAAPLASSPPESSFPLIQVCFFAALAGCTNSSLSGAEPNPRSWPPRPQSTPPFFSTLPRPSINSPLTPPQLPQLCFFDLVVFALLFHTLAFVACFDTHRTWSCTGSVTGMIVAMIESSLHCAPSRDPRHQTAGDAGGDTRHLQHST